MKLETFIHNLHFNTEKIVPPDWQIDWEDAPLPYKLYDGLPDIPLNADVPLVLNKNTTSQKPNVKDLGYYLWYVYGITQYAQFPQGTQSLRRFVPSGGALYPNELYVYIKLEEVPIGIYHYDAAHHRLLLLREGNFDSYLTRSLGNSYPINDCFCTMFVSTIFWKNFYKYNNFSYRLQGLDTGVLLGQSLEAANQMGFSSKVYFQFLDRAINHLLGLSEQNENVYAVISLSSQPVDNKRTSEEIVTATELCQETPLLTHVSNYHSPRNIEYPMLIRLNEASMFESTQSFVKLKKNNRMKHFLGTEIILPQNPESFSYDFAAVCRKRYSPEIDFTLGQVDQMNLATLLKETCSFSYQNDLGDTYENIDARVSLYGCFYNVEGVPSGTYSYDHSAHALRGIDFGDFRQLLQLGLTIPNVNLYQVPLCLHVIGDKNHLIEKLGIRGYRIQQMEAGILVQRLLLLSCALGMGGHPLLGFDTSQSDKLYRIESQGETSLIQIPIGPHRSRAWLKASLLT